MKWIIRLCVIFVIFYFVSHFFPEYLTIDGTQPLLLGTFSMYLISVGIAVLFIISFTLIPFGIGCLTTPLVFIAALFATPISLILIDRNIPGFNITGIWTYIILTVLINLLAPNITPKKGNKNGQRTT